MKRILLAMFLIASSAIGQDKAYTLEESIKFGLENSFEIKIANSELKYSLAKIDEVASQMLPQLSFNASYARFSDVPPFEVNVPISPAPIKIQDAILNNYSLKLSLQQPIFTGFRLSSLKSSANLNYSAEETEFEKSKNDKALAISNAYWNYYKTQNTVNLLKENLESLNNHLHNTTKFVENGLATKNDLLRIKVRVSALQSNLIDAKNAMEISRSAFNKEIGVALNRDTGINTPKISVHSFNVELKTLQTEAIKQRSELKALNFRRNAAENLVDAENSGWFPQLYAFGNFYYSNPNQRFLPIEEEFNDSWDIGVSLQWNLWDWGNTSAKAEQAYQKVIINEHNISLSKEAIQLEVYKNYLTVKSSIEKVKVNELAVESAEENYRVTEQKYNQQLATSSELIDAEVDLINAKTNLTNALVDYEVEKVNLNKSLGRKIY
jgi:outer membrane protein